MKGFMQWFKASNKMKRWMFLILIGILLACYGLAEILVMKEISFEEVGKVVVIFVLGFISIILGLIFLNKRTLEVLIEATDERMENKKNVNVKSLIFDKTVYDQGPNIVVIGGGTGLNTVLSGLKNYTSNLTAIVTVSDYGEGITNSRKELEMLPLGDVKDSMVSLATKEEEIEALFNYEFTNGKLKGLSFSDIYFSAMKEINGNIGDAIIKSNEVVKMIGKVIPVTTDEMKIVAELENGYLVEEKSRIAEVVAEKITKINRIFLSPSNCRPTPDVMEAIKKADCIIIGPGSLYTNVIPNLLVGGVAKAIKESTAIKVYVSNIMTEPGQTDYYSVSDHLKAIIDHCGNGIVDYCIYDTGEIIPEFIKKYNMEGQELVLADVDKVKGIKFLQRNLSMIANDCIRHDPNLVAASIIELICDDLKYQDKQNDPQYLMLNTKLREEKRISKVKKSMKKKEKKETKTGRHGKNGIGASFKGKSKFSNKYSDRIVSIREADANAKKKVQKEKIQKEKEKIEKKLQEENPYKMEEINIPEVAKAEIEEIRQKVEEKTEVEMRLEEGLKAVMEMQEEIIKTKEQVENEPIMQIEQEHVSQDIEEKKTTKPKSARGRRRNSRDSA